MAPALTFDAAGGAVISGAAKSASGSTYSHPLSVCARLFILSYHRLIYDNLDKDDAKVIAQLRSGDAKLNQFLARIKAIESATCACGAAPESIRHFLFSC